MNRYLDVVLKATGSRRANQVMLYFFDTENVEFIKKVIEETTKKQLNYAIDFDTNAVFEIMVEVYQQEILRHEVHDMLETISDMNTRAIKKGVIDANSAAAMQKYRKTLAGPRFCDMPICTKNLISRPNLTTEPKFYQE